MGELGNFQLQPVVAIGWLLQVALIAAVGLRGESAIHLREPSLSLCLLVVALGWVWRLAYLSALQAGDLEFWIGDDAVRWVDAWVWTRSPYLAEPDSPWLAGTSYVHGVGMWLVGDPLYGSKLVSALLCVFPLAGLFVFAHAILCSRALAAVSVAFLAPSWLDILLASGTMSEMPAVGLVLAGAGLCIAGLRARANEARTRRLLGSGLCFVAATAFHLVAWFQLAGILLVLLAYIASRSQHSLRDRLLAWVAFSTLSTIYCFAWVLNVWAETGSPLGPFALAVDLDFWKIGGPTQLLQHFGNAAGPWALGTLAAAAVSLATLAIALLLGNVREEGGARLSERIGARRWRAGLRVVAGVALACSLAAALVSLRHAPALPRDELERFATNLLVYPTALVHNLWTILPLAIFGIGVALFDRVRRTAAVRWSLGALAAGSFVLVASALLGGANLTPFRSVLLVSTALVPIALAPLFATGEAAAEARSRRGFLCVALAGLVFAQLLVANHQRIFAELPMPSIIRSTKPFVEDPPADGLALGAWLRRERVQPSYMDAENWARPFEIVFDDLGGLKQSLIQFNAGDPGWFARPERPHSVDPGRDFLRDLAPGQVVIADRPLESGALRHIVTIGHYRIYEGRRP